MAASRLRVYYGPNEIDGGNTATMPLGDTALGLRDTATLPLRDTVSLPLGKVLPLLMDAVKNRRQWVSDFCDDEIAISSDLYEVLLAYQHFRRPSA